MTSTKIAKRRWITPAGVCLAMAMVGALALPMTLVGLWFDLPYLRTMRLSLPLMVPTTGAALTLASLSLLVLRCEPVTTGRRVCALGMAAACALIGLGRLLDYITGANLIARAGVSFYSGMGLFLLGLSLLFLDVRTRRGPQPGQFFALMALHEIALVSLGFIFGNTTLYILTSSHDVGMSTHAAIFVALISIGVMCARPHLGFTAMLLSPTSDGIVMRRLLAMPYTVPLLTALLAYLMNWVGVIPDELRGWSWVFALFFSCTLVIWWVATVLRKSEVVRSSLEQRFRAVAESAMQAIFTVDRSGTIVYCNPAAERAFGRTCDDAVGRPFAALLSTESRQKYEAELQRMQFGGTLDPKGAVIDQVARRANGEEFPIEMSLGAWSVGGEPFFTAMLTDISRRRRAEEELRIANTQLVDANKELEAFSYSVSHDLRAPLRAINGFSKILIEEYAPRMPEEARDYLRDVRDGARQMGLLVDDLLAFARLSRQPVKTQIVEPDELVEECLVTLRHEQNGRPLEIAVDRLAACHGDPALLKQVWANLLANALKYSRKKDPARVEVGSRREDDGTVTYFVRDNGVGFDMRYADKLFGVFQRLHRAEEYEGTGVGLAIVQRIVHRHGGSVWADAKPGAGATFYFSLKGASGEESRG